MRLLAVRERLELPARRLLASEARRLEPALAPVLRLAIEIPDDHAIDPRHLTAALSEAVTGAGGVVREDAEVSRVSIENDRVRGVELAHGEAVRADHVVIAAGVWSSAIAGLPEDARVPIHPVKGQILRLHDPAGPGLLSHVVRMHRGYIVPRGDGRYVLGATMEERGHDTTVTAGPVHELLRDAIELVPGLDELVIDELSAGLRPGTPDNAPALGPGAVAGLHWATGHYRNGILLAPITAEIVVDAIASGTAVAHRAVRVPILPGARMSRGRDRQRRAARAARRGDRRQARGAASGRATRRPRRGRRGGRRGGAARRAGMRRRSRTAPRSKSSRRSRADERSAPDRRPGAALAG